MFICWLQCLIWTQIPNSWSPNQKWHVKFNDLRCSTSNSWQRTKLPCSSPVNVNAQMNFCKVHVNLAPHPNYKIPPSSKLRGQTKPSSLPSWAHWRASSAAVSDWPAALSHSVWAGQQADKSIAGWACRLYRRGSLNPVVCLENSPYCEGEWITSRDELN